MLASIAVLAALAGSSAVAAPVKRDSIPSTYYQGYLEPYATYHQRYLALSCQTHHNATSADAFFEACCHPLLATETLADRPAYCTPSASQNATEAANNASLWNATDADAGDCYNATSSAVSAAFSAEAAPTSSTIGQAAIQTSTQAAETTTSTYQAPASTSSSQAPAQTSQASSGGQFSGEATFFYQNGNPGSCGNYNSDSSYIAAIDQNFGAYNAYCGRQAVVTNQNNGKTVTVTIQDLCPTCVSSGSLDLSVGAFQAIAAESDGMVPITWSWA